MNKLTEPLFRSLQEEIDNEPLLAKFDFAAIARPSIRLATTKAPLAQLEIGDSRIGGVPDVPPEFEWPRWKPDTPRDDKFAEQWTPETPMPLAFIAQIDLSAMPRVDDNLPRTGWLYFFYDRYCEPWGFDPNDRGGCHVVYSNADRSSLVRIDPPADFDSDHVSDICVLEVWPVLTLPDEPPGIELSSEEHDAYLALRERIQAGESAPRHRLFGHADAVQGPMETECQLVSQGINYGDYKENDPEIKRLMAGAVDWQLLLQIDSDDEPGWMWGDVGMIYFWIRKQDLEALEFEGVWVILQCC